METKENKTITVKALIHAPITKVWELWTLPEHIIKWNNASDDWCTPRAENDLKVGGKFLCRMEAKDGSVGFDFSGVYEKVIVNKQIAYTLDDGRKVNITFTIIDNNIELVETFETENEYPVEMQREGWQSILNNFKKYVETN